jgi:N-acetylmuramoyl-L-alanine amidase
MKQTGGNRKRRLSPGSIIVKWSESMINVQLRIRYVRKLPMSSCPPVSRRLLLGRLGSGTGVVGTFLLPGWMRGALAATPPHSIGHAPPPPRQGARPPAPLVMLDPGHGGKDPGAIGLSGTYEKEVSLAAAFELKRLLETGGRYRVELTRARDVFIPLDERVVKAQAHGAQLFVSMHADAIADHSVRGASVYTLANTASDAQTAALAQRENNADRFGGGAWRDASPEVARILASLVRQETRVGSSRLARNLVGSLDRDMPMLPNPERHAGFVVLKAADIPSVLVEMGFMSNPRDETELRRPEHRARIAEAMRRAVDAYFTVAAHVADVDHAKRMTD